jgi:predicted ATPase/class 3 adenylate cyclase/DNA-binding CsgD family transcriptional regulator
MSETDAGMYMTELVPTGTVTLLLADVESSTRLWQSQPAEMTAAFAVLDRAVNDAVARHGGVRPVEQGEGDSFVIAFGRASDAVACALDVQKAPLAPIRLRIGIHTGEVQLRDESNYIGPTINRTARLRDLAHGGQTVLSRITEGLVTDTLPEDAWLADLGTHPLRDFPRPEQVTQLCHPDLHNEFPPLRVANPVRALGLPTQLTRFVGRSVQVDDVRRLLADNRLVTLSGAGGAGKTRLAIEIARLVSEFDDGICYVDLSPVTIPEAVPVTVARTVGLPDQPGRSTVDTIIRFISDRTLLIVLDNCEHLLDASGELIIELLNACPHLTILATSRETLGVAGEVTWRVPSLSLADEAVELFADRATRGRPGFTLGDDNRAVVEEICRRLDGMPLAIELAAARVRSLSLAQIADSLNDRFRLLTGGARSAVRRQQTLRASVDWSHALLTEPERTLFRRLAVFMGGFDLEAAQAVGGASVNESYQLLDQLSLLVDKSLVVAEDASSGMRYRLLETMRQYAMERLGESGETDAVRLRHRDHYTATAVTFAVEGTGANERLVAWAEPDIDNLRAAYTWSCELEDFESALVLASALQSFWMMRGRMREGLAAFGGVFADARYRDDDVESAVWVRAVADNGTLAARAGESVSLDRAQEALARARELGDPALIAVTLAACGALTFYTPERCEVFCSEAIDLLRQSGDWSTLCLIRSYQGFIRSVAGNPAGGLAAAREGRDVADAHGDAWLARQSAVWAGINLMILGRLADAATEIAEPVAEGRAARDLGTTVLALIVQGQTLAYQGHAMEARAAAERALNAAATMGGFHEDGVHITFANAALAAGDAVAAKTACEAAMRYVAPQRELFARSLAPMAEAALACGDLVAARRWADDTVAVVPGWHRAVALTARAQVALAQGELQQAGRDAREALGIFAKLRAYLRLPDALDCLARLASTGGNHLNAARLFGAAGAVRNVTGEVRYAFLQANVDAAVELSRNALGEADFDSAWAEASTLSVEEAIAFAQRGYGGRNRPADGWESLTPAERDVVALVTDGLTNAETATRLFVSPRTVQTHLTHVYTKLGLTSRVQLVQEAARHA